MREDLMKLYESMYKKEEVETPVDDTIEEGKSGHGDEKAVINLMKQAIKDGLINVKEVKNGWMIQSKVDSSQELIHRGERSFHYLRRFLNRIS